MTLNKEPLTNKFYIMKKMILGLALVVALTTSSAFAGEDNIPQKALESFKTEFSTAQDISWTSEIKYIKASFVFNGQNVFAFYTPEGEFLSTARYLTTLQLPLNLLTNLKNEYSKYWVSDLFEVSNNTGTAYYITLENADAKLMMKSTSNGMWNIYSKKQKI